MNVLVGFTGGNRLLYPDCECLIGESGALLIKRGSLVCTIIAAGGWILAQVIDSSIPEAIEIT